MDKNIWHHLALANLLLNCLQQKSCTDNRKDVTVKFLKEEYHAFSVCIICALNFSNLSSKVIFLSRTNNSILFLWNIIQTKCLKKWHLTKF